MQGSTQGALSLFTPQEFRRTAGVRPRSKAIAVFQTSKNNRGRRLQPTLAAAAPVRAPARLYSGQGGTAWIDESIDIGRGDSSYGLTLAG